MSRFSLNKPETPEHASRLEPFGEFLETLIEKAMTAAGRGEVEGWLADINVWEDGQTAMLRAINGEQIWFVVPPDNGPPRTSYAPFPIRRLATVPGRIILVLADLAARVTVNGAALKLSSATGIAYDILRDRAKSLRRDGVLLPPRGTRGHGADRLGTSELLNFLLAVMVTARPAETASAVRAVRTARFDKKVHEETQFLADGRV